MTANRERGGNAMNEALHRWTFSRIGGVDQVVLKSGDDIACLHELDQKLWAVLTMPARQHLMRDTLEHLDADQDGRIRVPDILKTIGELKAALSSLDILFEQTDKISTGQAADAELRLAIVNVNEIISEKSQNLPPDSGNTPVPGQTNDSSADLVGIGKAISLFSKLPLNGDGVVVPESTNDIGLQALLRTLIEAGYSVADASGAQGLDAACSEKFVSDAKAYLAWAEELERNPELLPAGEKSGEAVSLFKEIHLQLDEYFRRCKLLAMADAKATTKELEAAFSAVLSQTVSPDSEALKALPVAFPNSDGILHLDGPLHPEYEKTLRAFFALVELDNELTSAKWEAVKARFASYQAWLSAKPIVNAEALGAATLSAIVYSGDLVKIEALIEADKKMADVALQLQRLRQVALLKRDFLRILKNFVNLDEFYLNKRGIFQSGRLFLDSRELELCMDVTNAAAHAATAGLSSMYLIYCDLTKKDGTKKSVMSAFTAGDAGDIFVGRNGIFYDAENNDWDAVITKVVVQPISIREAFFSPYKWFVRTVEGFAMKRAAAAEAESLNKMKDSAGAAASTKGGAEAKAGLPAAAKKIDVGTVAAIGVALGSIGAMVTGSLGIFFGMGVWMPVGIIGVILLISGPSMILAYMKLRRRNIGPLLNAEGWAVNGKLKINVPFGGTLSHLSALPSGSSRQFNDPFAEKKSHWRLYVCAVLLIALVLILYLTR
ncbi:MAG: hypothetical protein M0P74_10800 [Syntrophales bacterium]|nr:hypothetical protein [Syntrophales bacterium]